MKIAIVVPDIFRMHGNRAALSIANSLSGNDRVDLYIHSINADLEEEVREKIGKSNLIVQRKVEKGSYGILFALKFQVMRGIDRSLSRAIIQEAAKEPYDFILVISNEGKSLAQFLKNNKTTKDTPIGIVVMELHDHGFHLYHERSLPWLRMFLWPLYPIVHIFERMRYGTFDVIFSNSQWTAEIFEYLYGLKNSMSIPIVDDRFFSRHEVGIPEKPYIAFPTVSITGNYRAIAKRLYDDGVNIITYGPTNIEGIPGKGFISDDEMVTFLSKASATLFLFNYEALGMIPLESLASGTPVITLPKQGPHAELRDNQNVFFTNSYEEIRRVCKDLLLTAKSKEISDKCRDSVMNYSSDKVAESLLNFIKGFSSSKTGDLLKN